MNHVFLLFLQIRADWRSPLGLLHTETIPKLVLSGDQQSASGRPGGGDSQRGDRPSSGNVNIAFPKSGFRYTLDVVSHVLTFGFRNKVTPMPQVVILEDDSRRIAAMRSTATREAPDWDLQFFVDANELVAWLKSPAALPDLISLDCDLDSTETRGIQCGSGEDVAEFLSSTPPNCPVIIHSTNALRAPAMHLNLALAGMSNVFLCPFRDPAEWVQDLRTAIEGVSRG